ncbi:hypothetical protein [Brunnivagina elsteri]|uniref:hypothetical protein n=1 Tax=Brunnivagina elsteri TaxID=1247191 RepID=UPI001B801766|nr:hypothetical protein [Calothrix elsteri]
MLGSVFILVSNITFAQSANAEEPTLEVDVTSSCTIEKVDKGELAVTNNNTLFSSKIPDGKSGIVSLDCKGSATVSISKPVQQNIVSGTTDFASEGELSATANNVELKLAISNPGNPSQKIIGSEENIKSIDVEVNMEAKKNSGSISPGKYEFKVTLTVAPD